MVQDLYICNVPCCEMFREGSFNTEEGGLEEKLKYMTKISGPPLHSDHIFQGPPKWVEKNFKAPPPQHFLENTP